MSGRFAVGAIFGGLLVLSPPFTLASLVIGGWVLLFHGVPDGGETATDGIVWASVWGTILVGILLALVAAGVGFWFYPQVTTVLASGLLLAVIMQRWLDRGGSDTPADDTGD